MEQYISWLRAWFSERGDIGDYQNQDNYFEAGLIDSFGVMELIGAMEEKFSVDFTEAHFQDRRFATVQGLAEILEEIQRAKV